MGVVANVLGLGRDANGSFAARVGEAPGQDLAARGIAEADVVMRGKLGWGPAWLVHEDLRTGRLVEVLAPWRAPAEPLWMLRTFNRRPPLRTQRVMSFLATLPANRDA